MIQLKKVRTRFTNLVLMYLLLQTTGCKYILIPRCPIKNCETKMIHLHGGKEFRGRHWWKRKQNPKIGELQKEIIHDPKESKHSPLPK